MKRIDETGKRYGNLLVLHGDLTGGASAMRWVCRCDCGTQTVVRGVDLRRRYTRSCGCQRINKIRAAWLKRSRGNALDRFDEDIL